MQDTVAGFPTLHCLGLENPRHRCRLDIAGGLCKLDVIPMTSNVEDHKSHHW